MERNPDNYFEAGGPSDHPLDQQHPGGGPWDRNDPDRPSAQPDAQPDAQPTDSPETDDGGSGGPSGPRGGG